MDGKVIGGVVVVVALAGGAFMLWRKEQARVAALNGAAPPGSPADRQGLPPNKPANGQKPPSTEAIAGAILAANAVAGQVLKDERTQQTIAAGAQTLGKSVGSGIQGLLSSFG